MEQPTTSFTAVGTGSTTSHLSSPFLELNEGFGGANQDWKSLCVVEGKWEGKGKINVFDVIGDWIQLQKYKCQLLHFPKRYSGSSVS